MTGKPAVDVPGGVMKTSFVATPPDAVEFAFTTSGFGVTPAIVRMFIVIAPAPAPSVHAVEATPVLPVKIDAGNALPLPVASENAIGTPPTDNCRTDLIRAGPVWPQVHGSFVNP